MDKKTLEAKVKELGPWHYCHILPHGVSTGDSAVPVQSEKLMLLVQAGVFSEDAYPEVMDLGANSGLISMWFADNKGSKIVAVENDDRFYRQLEFAVSNKGYTGKVYPVRADVASRGFYEGQTQTHAAYDLILNLGLMHHVPAPKHERVYIMMFNTLKPGGVVVVQTKNDQMVAQRLKEAGFSNIKKVASYSQGDRSAWTATKRR
jgi:2-polyprenyl-3-methyl-5-hydroxy-6-metoxy-1,4-benzoquinol methylase